MQSFVDIRLVERLRHVDNLSKEVYKSLDISPEKHNLWAVKSMRILTILTDDSILATHLRLEQNTIRRYFRQQHQINFDTVTIKMTIPPPQPVKVSKRASKISQQSAKVMTSIANGIDDEGLKEQLISLARQDNSN